MRLLHSWKVFRNRVEKYIYQADNLSLIDYSVIKDLGFSDFFYKYNSWIFFCHCYLKYSFDDMDNEFAQGFYSGNTYNEFLIGEDEETPERIEEALVDLKIKQRKLKSMLRLLSICDAVIKTDYVDLGIRAEYLNHEIRDLMLDKLYYLSDSRYYPLQPILKGNGINKSKEDVILIVKNLEMRGLLFVIYSDIITVKISPEGQRYVEERRNLRLKEDRIIAKPFMEGEPIGIEANGNNNYKYILYGQG